MKYSIIIPTYNHCDDLLRPCVESIFKYTKMTDVELIISANGCVDNTKWYLDQLKHQFASLGFSDHFKTVWNDAPLGYSGACNAGIRASTCDHIVLLNNDTLLLPQEPGHWLDCLYRPFSLDASTGISCVIKGPSEPAGHEFAIFFCVMISRECFGAIGLLNEEYGSGGGEDTEFSIEATRAGFKVIQCMEIQWSSDATLYVGQFPIYHMGEGTLHDLSLVPDHSNTFFKNSLLLAKKYNPNWYRWKLTNNWERAVYLKGDPVDPREETRYKWAASRVIGTTILDIGCSNGYGAQYLPQLCYTGLDLDPWIIDCAREQDWHKDVQFVCQDINTFDWQHYDTIIAFEVIEHLPNGLQLLETLKSHCNRLLITVPRMEKPGEWGPHHRLHNLKEDHFPGFIFSYINTQGKVCAVPGDDEISLMMCEWNRPE
jgi:glycosyltransferase involved in cell wall biosynthesis